MRVHENSLVNIPNDVKQVRVHMDILDQYLAGYTDNTQAKEKC